MSGSSNDSYVGGLFRTKSEANYNRSVKSTRRYYRGEIGIAKPRKRRVVRVVAPKPPSKRDQVAELLSEGLEFPQIAESLGLTIKAVRRHFDMIRKSLGAQAI